MPRVVNNATWMGDLGAALADKKLTDICLPGSHDSGAYEFTIEVMDQSQPGGLRKVYEALQTLKWFLFAGFIPDAIIRKSTRDWGKAQRESIASQLQNGIRWFDLRTMVYKPSWDEPADYYLYHGFIAHKISDTLDEIRTFIDANPLEIVALYFSHMGTLSDTDHAALVAMIQSKLETRICPDDGTFNQSIGHLQSRGINAVVFYDSQFSTRASFPWLLWQSSYYKKIDVDCTTVSALESDLETKIGVYTGSLPLNIGFTLTPDGPAVEESIINQLKNWTQTHDLDWFTQPARFRLVPWMSSHGGTRLGIVSTDFATDQDTALVPSCWSRLPPPRPTGPDHLALYRPGTGTIWTLRNQGGAFASRYQQGCPGIGIGGYDLAHAADRVLAFDYDGSGKLDHLVLYRGGHRKIWILKNEGGTFTPVYRQDETGSGIGGYDMTSASDRAFAFDHESSGNLDNLVLYRPGTGTISILANNGGSFTPVYQQGAPGNGIGGYDLANAADRVLAFDYDGSGKLDHLVLYRRGHRKIWILKNEGGTFTPVYRQDETGSGIGGYDMKSANDRAFAFDYKSSGKLDHLVLYRPGTGTMWILANNGGSFTPVYQQGAPGTGIGGYDLANAADRVLAFDYDGSGKLDHLLLYRRGHRKIWILKNEGGTFTPVYRQDETGSGIGGYDMTSANDRVLALAY